MTQDQEFALTQYFDSLKRLREVGVLKNSKDFTGQLGEWLASSIYNGRLSDNGIQPYWDFCANGLKYQVKTHAKAATTNRTSTDIKMNPAADVDQVVIIIFDENYKLQCIYNAPYKECLPLIKNGSLSWKKLKPFQVDLDTLPQKFIKFFK